MKYQKKYHHHIQNDFPKNIVRSVILKARQCGCSTDIAAIHTHRILTREDYKVLMLADKADRTDEIMNVYRRFILNIPKVLLPKINKFNDREISFLKLRSELKGETGGDENAGRSGTRSGVHISEAAFLPYAEKLEESIGNSVPLSPGTFIVYESTANSMSGNGEYFYNLWIAAENNETIYKPFFVAWYEVDNYIFDVPDNFKLTKYEIDLLKRVPEITYSNLSWRREKIRSYSKSGNQVFTPEERFKQDFPSFPEEAFLHSGHPVFNQEKLKLDILEKRNGVPLPLVKFTKTFLAMYSDKIEVYFIPEKNKKYCIGLDIAEGLAVGDMSTAFVLEVESRKQVASFCGKIPPDVFGKFAVELAQVYNNALLVPEMNNMGYATLSAIKDQSYRYVYQREIFDKDYDDNTEKLGWRTTSGNKQKMLSDLIAAYRDDEIKIFDIKLLKEMMSLTRESDGNVILNSKDKVVAACLAIQGLSQVYEPATIFDPNKKIKLQFETKDLFREKGLKN